MLTEPITISVNNLSAPVLAQSLAQREIPQKGREVVRAVKEPDSSRMRGLVDDVQKNLNMIHNVDLHFSVHEASGEIMVTVIEESTGEVIREIPSSEILNLAAKLDEMVGLIFDQEG
jgi:flagellar protein FlaG